MPARDRIDGEMLDSRDLLEVLEELEAEAEEGPLDEEDAELLKALQELNEEAPSEDWIYGATMIREDHPRPTLRSLPRTSARSTETPLGPSPASTGKRPPSN
jgi:hypothetical protein